MKKWISPAAFPALTIGLGGIGLACRFWLYSAVDASGLFPAHHASGYVVLAVILALMGALFTAYRHIKMDAAYQQAFPASVRGCVGMVILAAGIAYCGIAAFGDAQMLLGKLLLPVGIAAAAALVFAAISRLKGKGTPFLPFCLVCLFLILNTFASCRVWGAAPQIISYCFHLVASIFLMITAYHRTAATLDKADYRRFFVASQLALLFCCLVLNTQDRALYLAGALWLILDHPILQES